MFDIPFGAGGAGAMAGKGITSALRATSWAGWTGDIGPEQAASRSVPAASQVVRLIMARVTEVFIVVSKKLRISNMCQCRPGGNCIYTM
jgi:hypothetical protein